MKKAILALVACSVTAGPALAATASDRCPTSRETEAFETRQVQVEFMVAALSCQGVLTDKYNSFMRKFGPSLTAESQTFQSYFHRSFGRTSTKEIDSYLTSTANDVSQRALSTRDFCNVENRSLDTVLAAGYTGLTPETLHAVDIDTPARPGCTPRVAIKPAVTVATAAPGMPSAAPVVVASVQKATAPAPAAGAAAPAAAIATKTGETPAPMTIAYVPHGITVGPDGTPTDVPAPSDEKPVTVASNSRTRHTTR